MRKKYLKSQTGFTMLEMMIIVVIIGILASLAAPSFFNWLPSMHLKTDAKANLNTLREARSLAVSNNIPYGVYFDTDANQVYLFKDTNNPDLGIYETNLDTLVGAPICLDNETVYSSCTFNNDTVVFYPNGSSSNSGQITVQNDSGSRVYNVSVLASTGRVKLDQQ